MVDPGSEGARGDLPALALPSPPHWVALTAAQWWLLDRAFEAGARPPGSLAISTCGKSAHGPAKALERHGLLARVPGMRVVPTAAGRAALAHTAAGHVPWASDAGGADAQRLVRFATTGGGLPMLAYDPLGVATVGAARGLALAAALDRAAAILAPGSPDANAREARLRSAATRLRAVAKQAVEVHVLETEVRAWLAAALGPAPGAGG